MNFDLGEVLRRTWKIGWNHKVLWLYQMLPGLLGALIMPIFFLGNPAFTPLLPEPFNQTVSTVDETRFVIFTVVVTAILLIPAMFLSVLVQGATTFGALEADKGLARFSFREGIKASLPYFWRMFGLYTLFGTIWAVVIFAFMGINIGVSVLTLGLGSLCMMPMFLLLIPAFIVGYALLELAQVAIFADNLTMQASISKAWKLLRANALIVLVFMLILYIAVMLLSSIFMFPMIVPMIFLPVAIESSGDVRTPFMFVFFVFFPLMTIVMTIVQGILMAFFQSAWVVAYRHLNANPKAPVLVEAHA